MAALLGLGPFMKLIVCSPVPSCMLSSSLRRRPEGLQDSSTKQSQFGHWLAIVLSLKGFIRFNRDFTRRYCTYFNLSIIIEYKDYSVLLKITFLFKLIHFLWKVSLSILLNNTFALSRRINSMQSLTNQLYVCRRDIPAWHIYSSILGYSL